MGGGCSKRITFRDPIPHINNLIYYESCIGFTREMYEDEDQINSGPGFVLPFQGRNISQIIRHMVLGITAVSQNKVADFLTFANTYRKEDVRQKREKAKADAAAAAEAKAKKKSETARGKSGSKSDEYEFPPFDSKKHYQERLRELLKKLGLMEWEAIFMMDYDEKMAATENSELPASLRSISKLGTSSSKPKFDTPQLPALPSASVKSGGSGEQPYYLLGPAYLILSNDADSKMYIEAYLFFPSMTKDMKPSPNYDFLGKSHQWLNRLIRDNIYSAKEGGCEQSCFGTPQFVTTKREGRCNTRQTIYACGCRTDSDNVKSCYDKRREYRKEITKLNMDGTIGGKLRGQPIFYQFTVYRVDIKNPILSNLFTKDSSPNLMLNILPSEWNIFPGCKYSFLSRSGRYFTRFETTMLAVPGTLRGRGRRATMEYEPATRFGLYFSLTDDIPALCRQKRVPRAARPLFMIQMPGYPKRATIEGKMLNIYTSEEKALFGTEDLSWNMQIATEEAEEPIAMVLLDNGRFDVFDKSNKSVISLAFSKYVETGQATFIKDVMRTGLSTDDTGEYDPAVDYARRLEMLKKWLRARNLLVEIDAKFGTALDQRQVRGVLKDAVQDFQSFDINVDYEERYTQLVATLVKAGFKMEAKPKKTDAEPDASRRSRTPPKTSDVTFADYDETKDLETRLLQLKNAIHR